MSDLFSGFAQLTKSVTSTLNSYEMRKIGDKVQGYVLNFTEVELKVREATNEDPWGPTGPQMQEIAQLTFQYDAFPEIMGTIWKRMLQDNKLAWRRVYKSLILLNNLLKTGSERVIANAKDHVFEMRALESYSCVDERGRDQGVNIRHRVKQIMELLQDDELLMEERRKTKTEGKEKYQGFSREDMMMRGGSGKTSSYDSWSDNGSSKRKNSSGRSNFDFPEERERGGREVSSFEFDGSRNRSASPELGIPDNSRSHHRITNNDDDDDFGDFADARSSSQTAHAPAAQKNSLDLFGTPSNNGSDLSARVPKPPSGPTSPVSKTKPAANTLEGSLFDLDAPVIASPTHQTTAHSNNNAPSGGFDLFSLGAAPVQQPNTILTSPTSVHHEPDLFGGFASAPTVAAAPPASNNLSTSNDLDSFFGDFNSAPTSIPVATPTNNNNGGLAGWGDLIAPTPLHHQQPSNPAPPTTEQSAPALNDGWGLLEKQLDGLVLGNKQKPAPSMNELRSQRK